jgi:hypothetical protein
LIERLITKDTESTKATNTTRSRTMMRYSCVSVLFVLFVLSSSTTEAQNRVVEGRVTHPSASGRPVGVAKQWVVLHRVATSGGAPLDSTQTARDGRYRIRYVADTTDPDALYFVSSRYAGIAYFSPPLRGAQVRGGDADVIVYETTTDASKLGVQGRHLVVSAPRGGRREVAEIFELENPGTHTLVARDSTTPIWWTPIPAQAESASVAPGDVSAGAVTFKPGRAELYAPMSPGVRQVALTYLLDADAFPLAVPMHRKASLVEVLLEEPRASVDGAKLTEVAPATIEGRQFRRFLAQDAEGNAVMRVTAPEPVQKTRRGLAWLGVGTAVAMLLAIVLWLRRDRKGGRAVSGQRESESEQLIAQIAALDAGFERTRSDRASYDAKRAELKAQLARALAAEKQPV